MAVIMNEEDYYDGSNLLSDSHGLIFMTIGARGVGKTYWHVRRCIKRYITHGEKFIYLRRYGSEIKELITFFAPFTKEFPNHTLEVKGKHLYINKQLMGYVCCLSKLKTAKGVAFDNVKTIVYDEFMADTRNKLLYRYLNNEVQVFQEFFESVARTNDDVRAILIGNAESVANPFFIEYNIEPRITNSKGSFISKRKFYNDEMTDYSCVVLEYYNNPDFAAKKKQTKFGMLNNGTKYGRYLMDNDFKNDDSLFIERRPKNCIHFINVKFDGKTMGIWLDKENVMYVSRTTDDSSKAKFCFQDKDYDGEYKYIKSTRDSPLIGHMAVAYKNDRMRFTEQTIKQSMYAILRKLNVF